MSSRGPLSLSFALLAALLAASACGGKAIVDGTAQTGDGAGGSGGATSDGGSGICATPEPEGDLIACGSAPLGSGCYRDICDSTAHRWRASCSESGCSCTYGMSQVQCSCVGSDLDSFCAGLARSCCPEPFP